MTETVTVAATWLVRSININYSDYATISGQVQIALTPPAGGTPPEMFRALMREPYRAAGDTSYGSLSAAPINRVLSDVMAETVTASSQTISLATVLEALNLFFEQWQVEDLNTPNPAGGSP